MEQTESFSVGYLSQLPSLFVSKYALYYMYAYTCGTERTQGCKFMNLRAHTHIYNKLQLLVIKNICTIKLGFICKYIALKQKFSLEHMYLLQSRKIKLHECFLSLTGVLSFFFFNLES